MIENLSVIGVLVSTFQKQRICMQTVDMLTDTKKQCKQIENNPFPDTIHVLIVSSELQRPWALTMGFEYCPSRLPSLQIGNFQLEPTM